MPDLDDVKQALRREGRARRKVAFAAGAAAAAAALLEQFRRRVTVPPGAVVAGYWPAGSEMDVRPLLAWLHGAGHPVVLPVVVARDAPLRFRAWRPGLALEPADGGMVPPATEPERLPDLLLVPLLGFDRRGARLGQGGGHYDRTLLALRGARAVTAIGIAWAVQELSGIPVGPYDQPLDAVLTETGLIEAG